jgi:hypothetical protein
VVTPLKDKTIRQMAEHLSDRLNTKAREFGVIAVKTIRDYNTMLGVDAPYGDAPLLKVYRNSDSYAPNLIATTSATVAYGIINSEIPNRPGISRWVSQEIVSGLQEFSLICPTFQLSQGGISADYQLIVAGDRISTQLIHQVVVNFSFKEGYGN